MAAPAPMDAQLSVPEKPPPSSPLASAAASPRPWADDVEDDDEILLCGTMDGDADGAVFSVVAEDDPGAGGGSENGKEDGEMAAAAEEEMGEMDDSACDVEGLDAVVRAPPILASGGASNWVGAAAVGEGGGGGAVAASMDSLCGAGSEGGAVATGVVKRDLFRDHFDSLDQVSGIGQIPPQVKVEEEYGGGGRSLIEDCLLY